MLISIIIPTRERADYLRQSLSTCVAIPDPDIEIIVSDNASLDHTQEVIGSFNDSRIVNVNPGRRVSMRENFDFAIGKSSGDYVYMIGDDDGMLPSQFWSLREIVEEYRPNVFAGRPLSYGWPMPNYHRRGHVRLRRARTFGQPTFVDTAPIARNVAAGLADDFGLPRIYHGCASRKMLERMRTGTGAYLNSRAPDTYFTFHTLFNEKRFLFAEHPFSINGHSPVDIGGAHRYHPSDPRAQPAIRFAIEAETDPRQDQVPGRWKVTPLAYFSSLETVRRDSPSARIQPDYRSWYRQILAAARDKGDVFPEIVTSLGAYAQSIDTVDAFRAALSEGEVTPRRVASVAARIAKNIPSEFPISISGKADGRNDIKTATSAVDFVLGEGFLALARDPGGRARLWRRARLRSFRLLLPLPRIA